MATTEIGELLIRIRADMAKLEDALKKSGTQVKSFSDKMTSIGKNLTSAGLKLSLAVTAPLVLIGKKSIDAAMDVVESENLFEVSMGNMAKAARDWSEEFAKSVGLNEYNVRRNVGVFNVMFDSMGIGEQKAYDMAKGLTELSYDMASFYNMDVQDAFQKLQAGITGEIEPLKRLGIVVNETTVATYAYANGIAEQGAKLTEQEKIYARYLLIMDQTSKAQGDMARTLDSPANKMRIFKEQISLAMIELGQGLIPVILKVVDVIKPYVEKFTNASDQTKTFIVVTALIAASAGPILTALGLIAKGATAVGHGFVWANTASKGFLATWGPVIIAIAGMAWGIYKTVDAGIKLEQETANLEDAIYKLEFAFGANSVRMTENREDAKKLIDKIKEQVALYPELAGKIQEVIDKYYEGANTKKADIDLMKEEIINLISAGDAMVGYGKYMDDGKTSTDDQAQAVEELNRKLAAGEITVEEYNKALADYEEQTDEATKSTDDLRKSFSDLIDAIFDGLNASNDFQESQWAVEEAQKALTEAEKELEKAQKATGSTFTQNDATLQAYLSTNIGYLENQQQQAEAQKKLNEFIEKGDTTSLDYLKAKENLNNTITVGNEILKEAIKETGTYNSTGEQTEKQLQATAEATKNYEQAQNDLDAANLKLIEDSFALSESIYATAEQQEEARKKAVELGLEYVNTGLLSVEAFLEMASQFGLSSADIIKYADEMGIEIDEATRARLVEITADASSAFGVVGEVNRVLDDLSRRKVTVPVGISYAPGMPEKPGEKKQTGGEVVQTGYIPDLNIIGIKGEGFLTREIMNAIKTGRTDYMGVSGRQREIISESGPSKAVVLHIPLNLDGKMIYDIWEKYDLREEARRIK